MLTKRIEISRPRCTQSVLGEKAREALQSAVRSVFPVWKEADPPLLARQIQDWRDRSKNRSDHTFIVPGQRNIHLNRHAVQVGKLVTCLPGTEHNQ